MNGKQRRQLRGLAHALKPVVIVGQRGLGDRVIEQIDGALTTHELIKVKLAPDAPLDRDEAAEVIRRRLGCEVAGIVGRVLILYRPHPEEPRIQLVEARESGKNELGGRDGSL
jgi:RNA-binding protein